jgi:hypothetical protein
MYMNCGILALLEYQLMLNIVVLLLRQKQFSFEALFCMFYIH